MPLLQLFVVQKIVICISNERFEISKEIETLIRLFYGYDLAPLIKMINLNLFGKNSKKFLESLENDLKINPGRWF